MAYYRCTFDQLLISGMPAILSPPYLNVSHTQSAVSHEWLSALFLIHSRARFHPQPIFCCPLYGACWFSLLEPRCSQSRLEVRCLAASATSRTPNCLTRMGSSCLGKCVIELQKMTWGIPRRFRSSRSKPLLCCFVPIAVVACLQHQQ